MILEKSSTQTSSHYHQQEYFCLSASTYALLALVHRIIYSSKEEQVQSQIDMLED